MKIGFYGHSNCAFRGTESFLDIFAQQLNADIVNTGVRQGSEERILYELKKTKKLDLAIIFHSYPNYLFLPGCDRDFDTKSIIESHANYIWKSVEIEKIVNGWEHHLEHHAKFINKFQTVDNFVNVLKNYKEYLYDPDLQTNRFYGALIQIDQYLAAKNITAIHVIENGYLPTWLKFRSGIEDFSIVDIINKTRLEKTDPWCANGITAQGNIEIANRLFEMYAACSR